MESRNYCLHWQRKGFIRIPLWSNSDKYLFHSVWRPKVIYKQNITYKAVVSVRPAKDMQGYSTTGYGEMMRDILPDLDTWRAENKSIALATVVQTWGSSPRRAGAKMALTPDGKITGSVSGGCVEGAVYEAGVDTLKSNRPQLLHFGVADETAWEVGLACGGSIDIFVKPLDKNFFEILHSVIENEEQAVHIMVVRGPNEILGHELLFHENGQVHGSLGKEWDGIVSKLAHETLFNGISRRVVLNEDIEIFVEAILPSPTLIIVGGVHIAISLTSMAK